MMSYLYDKHLKHTIQPVKHVDLNNKCIITSADAQRPISYQGVHFYDLYAFFISKSHLQALELELNNLTK